MDWLYIGFCVLIAVAVVAALVIGRRPKQHAQTGQSWKKGDSITTTPIDNPLDFRADGSIHPGDPGWEIVQAAMEGEAVVGHQNPDGTWTIEKP